MTIPANKKLQYEGKKEEVSQEIEGFCVLMLVNNQHEYANYAFGTYRDIPVEYIHFDLTNAHSVSGRGAQGRRQSQRTTARHLQPSVSRQNPGSSGQGHFPGCR